MRSKVRHTGKDRPRGWRLAPDDALPIWGRRTANTSKRPLYSRQVAVGPIEAGLSRPGGRSGRQSLRGP